MALEKVNLPINFGQGLDTQTDAWQVAPGKFLSLENSIFNKGGQLTKRNGFGLLQPLPDTDSTLVTTYSGNLTAIGNVLRAYSAGSQSWIEKGALQPAEVDVLSVLRSNIGQTQVDSVVHPNGLVCSVLTEQVTNNSGVLAPSYKYMLTDSITGQRVVAPTAIPSATGTVTQPAKVFLLGNNFVLVFTNMIGSTNHLQYVTIGAYSPTTISAPVNISTTYSPGTTDAAPQFEGTVSNNYLYIAYNGSDGGGAIRVNSLSQYLVLSSAKVISGYVGNLISVCVDETTNTVHVTSYNSSTKVATAHYLTRMLLTLQSPVTIFDTAVAVNLTTAATDGILTVLYEQNNTYNYGDKAQTNVILKTQVSSGGTVIVPSLIARSLGLASKAFIINNRIYVLGTYVSAYQPTYFLIDSAGNVIVKLAYANGPGAYYTGGLTNVTLTSSDTVSFSYLIKDRIEAVNKSQGVASVGGIYSQTGVNLASIALRASGTITSEIGKNLHLTGGFMWMYDGATPVEHGFHLWPDNVQAVQSNGGAMKPQKYFYTATYEWTDAQGNVFRSAPSLPIEVDNSAVKGVGVAFQAVFIVGDTTLTVNSTSGLYPGMVIIDNSQGGAFPSGTKIVSVGVGSIVVDNAALLASATTPGDNLSTTSVAANVSFTANSTSAQAVNLEGLKVGMIITDPSVTPALSADTAITSIDTTTKIIGLSKPTLRASASDQISTTAPTTKAWFEAGSTTLTVNSTEGFTVGRQLVDSTVGGAFAANTRITAIDATTGTITIDKPTLSGTGAKSIFAAYPRASAIAGSGYFGTFGYQNALYIMPFLGAPDTVPVPGQGIFCDNTAASPGMNIVAAVYPGPASYVFTGVHLIPPGNNFTIGVRSNIYLADVHTITSPATIVSATFPTGVTTLNVSSTADLFVGQTISDLTTPGNLAVGTTITAINSSANTITVDTPTTGATTPEIFLSTDVLSTVINIPTLRLTYKTANPVRIALYRWSTDQQTYYQVTPVANPLINNPLIDSVSYTDILADSAILGNNILYTTGGVVENIEPPSISTMALFKSRLFAVDSENRNLLWYSKQVIENTPVEMSDLFTIFVAPTSAAQGNTGPITALAALDDKLIIFKKNAMYYITGNGPDNTGINNDFSEPVFITSAVGCADQQSVVFCPSGIMFQSEKGIWLLGRDLSTSYIGAPVDGIAVDNVVLSAVNVPATNEVRFMMADGSTIIYDYYFQQWGTFTNLPAVSSTIYQNLHTFIDKYGRVLQETPGKYLDAGKPVLLSFKTSWLNLAGLQGFERAYFFYLLGQFLTPHKLQLQIAYDYNASPTQTSIITPDNYVADWGGESVWGGGGNWGGPGNVEQYRVFLQQQKCQAFQITLTEIFDPSQGAPAGAGLTLSGLNCVVGLKGKYPRLKASKSVG